MTAATIPTRIRVDESIGALYAGECGSGHVVYVELDVPLDGKADEGGTEPGCAASRDIEKEGDADSGIK